MAIHTLYVKLPFFTTSYNLEKRHIVLYFSIKGKPEAQNDFLIIFLTQEVSKKTENKISAKISL